MEYLMIKCNKADSSFIEETKTVFPNTEIIEEVGFSGEEWIMLAISLAGLSIQIADFLLTHLAKPKNEESSNESNKRVIITSDGEISIIGYSRDDVVKILEELKQS